MRYPRANFDDRLLDIVIIATALIPAFLTEFMAVLIQRCLNGAGDDDNGGLAISTLTLRSL